MTAIILALAGTIIAAFVGTFWYMPNTPTGKIHMKYLGFDKLSKEELQKIMDSAKPHMWKSYSLQMILSFLTAFATVFIITMSVQNGVSFTLAFGFVALNWLCFMVPVYGANIIWGNTAPDIAWQKFFSDISASLLILILIAFLTSFFV